MCCAWKFLCDLQAHCRNSNRERACGENPRHQTSIQNSRPATSQRVAIVSVWTISPRLFLTTVDFDSSFPCLALYQAETTMIGIAITASNASLPVASQHLRRHHHDADCPPHDGLRVSCSVGHHVMRKQGENTTASRIAKAQSF